MNSKQLVALSIFLVLLVVAQATKQSDTTSGNSK
jgi:hypothetical protein